jgi:Flp pilus assembly protein TadB
VAPHSKGYNCEAELVAVRGEIMGKLAVVDTKLATALEGVSNFKAFQKEASEFFTTSKVTDAMRNADLGKQRDAVREALKAHDEERSKALAAEEKKKRDELLSQDKIRARHRRFWNTLMAAGVLTFTVMIWYGTCVKIPHDTAAAAQQAVRELSDKK